MALVSLTCIHCSGSGKQAGLLDADQARPPCSVCNGKGAVLVHSSVFDRGYRNHPRSNQMDLFEENQGDQGCTDASTVNGGTSG